MAIDVTSPNSVAVPSEAAPALGGGRFSSRDRMVFTERLALMLESGMPLHASLEALAQQARSPKSRELLGEVAEAVTTGHTFASALARQGDAFPLSYTNLVAAAETGGFLPKVLERLLALDEKWQELRSAMMAAMAYPAFLVAISGGVVAFVLLVVFPKFEELFALIADDLPYSTLVLMRTSDFLRGYWPVVIALLVGLPLLFRRWLMQPSGRRVFDGWISRLPLVGGIVVQLNVVQLMHVLSLSLANGVPLLEALGAAREVLTSDRFRRFVGELEDRVRHGGDLSGGFREADWLPELVVQLVATGESTGNLSLVAGRVAEHYEREWRKKLELVSKLVEPALLILMGGVVGLIVTSLILPIFKLSHAVH